MNLENYTINQIIEHAKSIYPEKELQLSNIEMENGKTDVYLKVGDEEKVLDAKVEDDKLVLTPIEEPKNVQTPPPVTEPAERLQPDVTAKEKEDEVKPSEEPKKEDKPTEEFEAIKSMQLDMKAEYEKCKSMYDEIKTIHSEIQGMGEKAKDTQPTAPASTDKPTEEGEKPTKVKLDGEDKKDLPEDKKVEEKTKSIQNGYSTYSLEDSQKYFPAFIKH